MSRNRHFITRNERIRPCVLLWNSLNSLTSKRQVLLFRIYSLYEVHAFSMPTAVTSVCRSRYDLSLTYQQENQVLTVLLHFRHLIKGSLAFISIVTHLTVSHCLFPHRSRHSLFTIAAWGGLIPASDCRNREANSHL